MEMLDYWKSKVRKLRLRGIQLLLISIAILAIFIILVANDLFDDAEFVFPILGITIWVLPIIGFVLLISPRLAWRKYNGNFIIYYGGIIKKHLIINEEIQAIGGAFQYDFYGQLPDGTDVHVNVSSWSGNVKFSLGSTNNHNISFL